MTKPEIIEVKLSEIKLNPNNPRLIKDDKFKKLVNSIKEFPQMLKIRPIVVNSDMVILGGNMRYKACKEAGLKEVSIIVADNLTEDQQREFLIKDNVSGGEWDWEVLSNEWDTEKLEEWGLDLVGFDLDSDELGTDFSLPDGDKAPFQQMTFTLADEQAEQIKNAIADIKQTEEYKYCETMGNENSNGNALYLIIMQWVEQKK
jgi:ParB-like chromosome segregation protein Spo0J